MYILVADSCGCGLGILGEIVKYNNMPHAIFLADGQMNPFGLRSVSEIQDIVEDWLKYFTNPPYAIKMLVVACNTASISIMGDFQKQLEVQYNIPILNIVESTVQAASEAVISSGTNKCNIAVLGTKRTIESGIYQRLIIASLSCQDIQVQGIICTSIEKAVAQKEISPGQLKQIVECELHAYRGQFNYVVHACTCFPFVEKEIDHILDGGKQKIVHINSSRYVARDVYEVLKQINFLQKENHQYKEPLLFATGGQQWINYVDKVRKLVFDKPILVEQIQIRK